MMIQPAKQVRRVDVKRRKKQAVASAQSMINAVLWQIIQQSKPEPEEGVEVEVEQTDVTLTVPIEELKDVPANLRLHVDHNKAGDALLITAGINEPKSIIIQPGGDLVGN